MSVAKYYPFNGERGQLRLGLRPIDFENWIQYEDDFVDRVCEKKYLIRNLGRRVLDFTPSSIPAQQELLQLILNYLHKYRSKLFEIQGQRVISLQENKTYSVGDYDTCPIELISYLVADDFCILESDDDDYKLVAASVCAPTWWSLSEKMGNPLVSIHQPIAHLEDKIGHMIQHFFQNLKVEDCYQRSNWFLFTKPDLCVFPNSFDMHKDMASVNAENIEKRLYLRIERQTFRKLKNTSNIVFGIKVYTAPISIVRDFPKIAEDLIQALSVMDMEQKQALAIDVIEKPLSNYLQNAI